MLRCRCTTPMPWTCSNVVARRMRRPARIELARVLAALDRSAVAASEARLAWEALHGMGAALDAARALALLKELGVPHTPVGATTSFPAGLTRREAEVLGLLACGLSNHDIANELFLSVRTV